MEPRGENGEIVRLDNGLALLWSLRLFGIGFVLAPLAIWAILLSLGSTEPGFSIGSPTVLMLTALVAAIVLVGYFLTLGRTPREVLLRSTGILVMRPWRGRNQVLRLSDSAYFVGLERYSPGILSRLSCELVQVHTGHGHPSKWIVMEGLLDDHLERWAGKPTRGGPRALPPPS